MKLGKLGVFSNLDDLSAAQCADFAKRVEQWGYSALWMPEGLGRDTIDLSGWMLSNTRSLVLATGIASIYARDPMLMRAGQMSLNERSGGRFLLGVGVSHQKMVVNVRGHDYGKPIGTMRQYLAAMKAALYTAPVPAEAPKTVIAALGPKMLELSRDAADGAHPYNVSPAHTAMARKILGPGKLLCVEQMVLLESDAHRARAIARETLALYLGMPNYVNNWLRMGYTPQDVANGGSDRLIDDVVAWGDEAALVKRIEQHWEAGADHVCIQSIHPHRTETERLLASVARLNL